MVHSPGFLKIVSDAKSRIVETDLDGYRGILAAGTHILVDVREDREWNEGHAQGAVHIGKGVIERDIEHQIPDKDTPLVLYCGGGYRSALAADALRAMGYTKVISLDGGWRAYQASGLPVEI